MSPTIVSPFDIMRALTSFLFPVSFRLPIDAASPQAAHLYMIKYPPVLPAKRSYTQTMPCQAVLGCLSCFWAYIAMGGRRYEGMDSWLDHRTMEF